jgi:hypothetical protein
MVQKGRLDVGAIASTVRSNASLAVDDCEREVGPFVLNLCPVQQHIAIPQPRSAHLTNYAIFLSRGLEGGRERCWLHMGYFSTRAEAQKWLGVLQRVYPEASVTSAALTFVAPDRACSPHGGGQRRK